MTASQCCGAVSSASVAFLPPCEPAPMRGAERRPHVTVQQLFAGQQHTHAMQYVSVLVCRLRT
jgi:hypothetical protein